VALLSGLSGLLRAYSQVLFTRSRVVGALLLLATLLAPEVGLVGLASVALAQGLARLGGVSPADIEEGLVGYNALLVGLGVAALAGGSAPGVGLALGAAAAAALLAAALRALLARAGLPSLTLAFVFTLWIALGAAAALGLPRAAPLADPFAPAAGLPDAAARLLQGLGALFFVPRADAGLLVLAALLIYSRYAALLAGLGLALAGLISSGMDPSQAILQQTLGFNMALTALAVGGVWFVPGPSALVAGLAASGVAGLLTLGAAPLLGRLDLPVAVLPLNLAVPAALLAARLRVRDGAPKSVDFLPGTPEENLHYFRTRVARFGGRYLARFAAPFPGRWVVTQGEDGEYTHQGRWSSALDFEVAGLDGALHGGDGGQLADWHCYRLPALAPADGTVARVIDGLPDSAPGQQDLDHSWGNLVVIWHGPGVYSLLSHLSPGSVAVAEGQFVRRGVQVGLVGSSGRSPEPHLHFQLQASAEPGSPTLPVELHDVVLVGEDGAQLAGAVTPVKGVALRNIEADPAVARLLAFPLGRLRFAVGEGPPPQGQGLPEAQARARAQEVLVTVDLTGRRLMRSERPEATLRYAVDDRLFTIYDSVGSQRSVLHLLHLALPRVPFEPGLRWRDHLPLRRLMPPGMRLLLDPVEPFLPGGGLAVDYSARREGRSLVVEGRSQRTNGQGEPWVSTRATLSPSRGLTELVVTVRGRTRHALRLPDPPPAGAQELR
jgi:murein DD-endopeptidase MepM/ murein hydrolase activator NlpD